MASRIELLYMRAGIPPAVIAKIRLKHDYPPTTTGYYKEFRDSLHLELAMCINDGHPETLVVEGEPRAWTEHLTTGGVRGEMEHAPDILWFVEDGPGLKIELGTTRRDPERALKSKQENQPGSDAYVICYIAKEGEVLFGDWDKLKFMTEDDFTNLRSCITKAAIAIDSTYSVEEEEEALAAPNVKVIYDPMHVCDTRQYDIQSGPDKMEWIEEEAGDIIKKHLKFEIPPNCGPFEGEAVSYLRCVLPILSLPKKILHKTTKTRGQQIYTFAQKIRLGNVVHIGRFRKGENARMMAGQLKDAINEMLSLISPGDIFFKTTTKMGAIAFSIGTKPTVPFGEKGQTKHRIFVDHGWPEFIDKNWDFLAKTDKGAYDQPTIMDYTPSGWGAVEDWAAVAWTAFYCTRAGQLSYAFSEVCDNITATSFISDEIGGGRSDVLLFPINGPTNKLNQNEDTQGEFNNFGFIFRGPCHTAMTMDGANYETITIGYFNTIEPEMKHWSFAEADFKSTQPFGRKYIGFLKSSVNPQKIAHWAGMRKNAVFVGHNIEKTMYKGGTPITPIREQITEHDGPAEVERKVVAGKERVLAEASAVTVDLKDAIVWDFYKTMLNDSPSEEATQIGCLLSKAAESALLGWVPLCRDPADLTLKLLKCTKGPLARYSVQTLRHFMMDVERLRPNTFVKATTEWTPRTGYGRDPKIITEDNFDSESDDVLSGADSEEDSSDDGSDF